MSDSAWPRRAQSAARLAALLLRSPAWAGCSRRGCLGVKAAAERNDPRDRELAGRPDAPDMSDRPHGGGDVASLGHGAPPLRREMDDEVPLRDRRAVGSQSEAV